jgi:hypothetical protein
MVVYFMKSKTPMPQNTLNLIFAYIKMGDKGRAILDRLLEQLAEVEIENKKMQKAENNGKYTD